MFQNTRPSTKVAYHTTPNKIDGNPIQNVILLGLPEAECEALFPMQRSGWKGRQYSELLGIGYR